LRQSVREIDGALLVLQRRGKFLSFSGGICGRSFVGGEKRGAEQGNEQQQGGE